MVQAEGRACVRMTQRPKYRSGGFTYRSFENMNPDPLYPLLCGGFSSPFILILFLGKNGLLAKGSSHR